jgi:multimeric flavodoxin WrbA
MRVLFISGSPRKRSNTDYLLNYMQQQIGGEIVKISDYAVEPCKSCWACLKKGSCVINDDMKTVIVPKILKADAMVLGSPVYFNNVSAQLKAFIDRTWSLRGKLRNKIGGAVVVSRKYGAEAAIMAINSFFLKHDMIIANRGISGVAFNSDDIKEDLESLEAATKLTTRILELGAISDKLKRRDP